MSELLKDMDLFVEVARRQSFTRAADALGMPLSSLSRRMRDFEQSLGIQLINRSTRRLELTPIGQEYFLECERIVADAAGAHERLVARRGELKGRLRLSLTPDFGAIVFRPLLAEFATSHPEVSFDLDLTPGFVDLIAGNIDVAVRFGNPADSGLTMRFLGVIRHGLYATPRYLAQRGTPLSPDELATHTGIVIRHASKTSKRIITRDGRPSEVILNERFSSNHLSMILNLALMDFGICILPEVMARSHVQSGALKALLDDWKSPDVPVVALTATKLLPARVRAFLEFLVARTGEVL